MTKSNPIDVIKQFSLLLKEGKELLETMQKMHDRNEKRRGKEGKGVKEIIADAKLVEVLKDEPRSEDR